MVSYDLKNYYDWPIMPRILLIGLSCFMIFSLAYYIDFSTLNKRIHADQLQENNLIQQLEIIFKRQAELYTALSKQTELNKTLNEFQAKLVNSKHLPEALNEILKIGSANGLQFSSFDPDKEELEGIYTKLPIKIIVVGTYDQIANFVDQLARMTPLITVDDILIQKPEKVLPTPNQGVAQPHAQGSLVTEIILNAYYLNGEKKNENKN